MSKTFATVLKRALAPCLLSVAAAAAPPASQTAPATARPEVKRPPALPAVPNTAKQQPTANALGTSAFRRSGRQIQSAPRDDLSRACGLQDLDAPHLAAIAVSDGGNVLCGACAEVTGPAGSTVVKIASFNPDGLAPAGTLHIDEAAYAAVTGRPRGTGAFDWRLVPCASSGPLRYRFRLDVAGWSGLTVQNHCRPIQRIEMRKPNGAWRTLTRGAMWTPSSGSEGRGVVELRITDFDGMTTVEPALDVSAPASERELVLSGTAPPAGCR